MQFIKVELIPQHQSTNPNHFCFLPYDAIGNMTETSKDVFIVHPKSGYVANLETNVNQLQFVNDPKNILTL